MSTTIPPALARRRDYAGPALFSYGFRPFFLGGALWAALGMLLWVPLMVGGLSLPSALTPVDWHIYESVYGYAGAVVAGFLLTAIPNWTGRLPVNGVALAGLALLWLAGRLAVLFSAWIGHIPAALIDVMFFVALAACAAREIVAGQNWRNLRILVLVCILIGGNIVFHLEALRGAADYGVRIGVAALIVLIMLIGGRIVPSFTRNWLARQAPGRLPAPFGRFDALCLAAGALALVAWIAMPDRAAVGVLLLIAGLLHVARLARWAGERTFADRLVLVLHVGYAFVPIGFLLLGAALVWPAALTSTAGIHAWTTGAIGVMTLAVMTRASLGHTGRSLTASPATQAIYACAILAALARIAAAFVDPLPLLYVAAVAWIAAFGGFVVVYGPILFKHPPSWSGRTE